MQPTTPAALPQLSLDAVPLSADLRRRIQAELSDDEELLWCGQPLPNRALGTGLLIAFFGVPFTLFSIFWTYGVWSVAGPLGLFGAPFIVVGLGLLTAPLHLRRAAQRTVYAVTNRRAITIEQGSMPWSSATVRSIQPEALGDVERRENARGVGDLVLERRVEVRNGRSRTDERGFMGIADVAKAERAVRALARKLD
jgi:hypothetical protein